MSELFIGTKTRSWIIITPTNGSIVLHSGVDGRMTHFNELHLRVCMHNRRDCSFAFIFLEKIQRNDWYTITFENMSQVTKKKTVERRGQGEQVETAICSTLLFSAIHSSFAIFCFFYLLHFGLCRISIVGIIIRSRSINMSTVAEVRD